MKMIKDKMQPGLVSLFVVIFATILISVVTVSFATIMIQNQQDATSGDLSQSAYDSALAGVESAKNVLAQYDKLSEDQKKTVVSDVCNEVVGSPNKEVVVSEVDNQAYTCVTVVLDTDNYLGSLDQGESVFIPLKGVSSFTKVKIEWSTSADIGSTGSPTLSTSTSLLTPSNWSSKNWPAIMRAQLIQYDNSNFTLDSLDSGGNGNSTRFLYPAANGGSTAGFSSDPHRAQDLSNAGPVKVKCDFSNAYACSATVSATTAITGAGYLRLTALYNKTHFKVTLMDNNSIVKFNNVQPEVDSTGRADNLFRRVKARVTYDKYFPYPEATVDISGNLCKNFLVTNDESHYKNYCSL